MKGEGVRERVREGVKQRGGEGAWEGVVEMYMYELLEPTRTTERYPT